MIVKMKFLSITGPRKEIDHAIDTYLSKYEIQLENAMTEFKNVRHLHPITESNPYREVYQKASEYVARLTKKVSPNLDKVNALTLENASSDISSIEKKIEELIHQKEELSKKLEDTKQLASELVNFLEVDFDIDKIFAFKFMKFRFGKMSKEFYNKYVNYIEPDLDAIFYKSREDEDYVWGVYFVPTSRVDRVDAVFSSLHFDRANLDDNYDGTPKEAYQELQETQKKLTSQIAELDAKIKNYVDENAELLMNAYTKLEKYNMNYEVRKLAAYTKKDEHEFFMLCGWMPESDAKKIQEDMKKEEDLFCIFEEEHANVRSNPPTKLKNAKIIRPFETLTKMYGLPNYKEFDPTIIIALTYSFIFGVMFGDVGQGFLLFALGLFIYFKKKMALAACISCCGVFSMFFGFMFGSIFGFEDIIEPVWLRPMKAMTTLPFIGQLNTVFVVAIVFGMFLILAAMVLHIINMIRMREKGDALFDANGVAGLVFYGSIVAEIFLLMTGHVGMGSVLAIIMFGLPLLCIALKEPLSKILEKKKEEESSGIGMFLVTTFFELFEVLLSYFSNTLSFVRIGAFAVSHAAMMEVVLMLAGAESGTPNYLVVVLGNLFVCCLEGLIVGIQVLRLEYYELFSRYYKGDGKEFKPFMKN